MRWIHDCGSTFPMSNIFAGQGVIFDLGRRAERSHDSDPFRAGMYLTMRTTMAGFNSFPGSLMGVMAYIHQIYLDADHYKEAKQIIFVSILPACSVRLTTGFWKRFWKVPACCCLPAREVEVDRMIQALRRN